MGEIQEKQADEGLKATEYILGDATTDGHTHLFYLRDDLPIATTSAYSSVTPIRNHHEHSIEEGPNDTVVCLMADDHIHTVLKVKEEGDYKIRTLANG